MTRLIDADALIDKYQSECSVDVFRYEVIEDLCNAPTVDAVPVKHGKWINTYETEEWYGYLYECSACGSRLIEKDNYCPHCGARMDG